MSELISVQPAKPGDGTNMAYSGLSGVWYTDQERDSGLKVFFAVTMRTIVLPDGITCHGQMQDAMQHMQQFINWHVDGLMEIHHQCIWRDPADQRQPGDRNAYESSKPAGNAPTTPDGNPIKTLNIVKIEKEYDSKNKIAYIGLYASGHQYATLRVKSTDKLYDKCCDQLAELTSMNGKPMDWRSVELGTSVTCNLVCGYTDSINRTASGNPYKNFYGIRAK